MPCFHKHTVMGEKEDFRYYMEKCSKKCYISPFHSIELFSNYGYGHPQSPRKSKHIIKPQSKDIDCYGTE